MGLNRQAFLIICVFNKLFSFVETFERTRFYNSIESRSGDEDEDEEPANCAAPLTCKEKDLLRYYYYIHNGIATKYVAGIDFKVIFKLFFSKLIFLN